MSIFLLYLILTLQICTHNYGGILLVFMQKTRRLHAVVSSAGPLSSERFIILSASSRCRAVLTPSTQSYTPTPVPWLFHVTLIAPHSPSDARPGQMDCLYRGVHYITIYYLHNRVQNHTWIINDFSYRKEWLIRGWIMIMEGSTETLPIKVDSIFSQKCNDPVGHLYYRTLRITAIRYGGVKISWLWH